MWCQSVCKKLKVEPSKGSTHINQLDWSKVKVIDELKYVLIILASNPKVHLVIDIIVVDTLMHMDHY